MQGFNVLTSKGPPEEQFHPVAWFWLWQDHPYNRDAAGRPPHWPWSHCWGCWEIQWPRAGLGRASEHQVRLEKQKTLRTKLKHLFNELFVLTQFLKKGQWLVILKVKKCYNKKAGGGVVVVAKQSAKGVCCISPRYREGKYGVVQYTPRLCS